MIVMEEEGRRKKSESGRGERERGGGERKSGEEDKRAYFFQSNTIRFCNEKSRDVNENNP